MLDWYQPPSDKHVFKISILILLGIVLLVGFIQLTCRTPKDSEALIQNSAKLREHDAFCFGLPRPSDFELRYKMVGGNSHTVAISYWFSSSLRYTDVKDFYEQNLLPKGWTGTGAVFTKDGYTLTVHIDNAASEPERYSVYCGREVP
ncbi:MAG: hypothetical protein ACKVQJ_08290 [Pyrinomonadaceae bacterium]